MKKKNLNNFLIVGVFLLLVGVLIYTNKNTSQQEVRIAGETVHVEIAKTQEEKTRGLSGRESLEEGTGMLFYFDRSGFYPFWMKDMKFAIDIIWIGEEMQVVEIVENAKPSSYPSVLGGSKEARYVLEVNAGFAQEHKLKVGDTLSIEE